MPIFTKKIGIFSPLEFFENENFGAHVLRAPKLWIWTSKIMPDPIFFVDCMTAFFRDGIMYH